MSKKNMYNRYFSVIRYTMVNYMYTLRKFLKIATIWTPKVAPLPHEVKSYGPILNYVYTPISPPRPHFGET